MFQYIKMPFGLANAGSVYSRMLDVVMKDVDRDFWTFYLDNILTFSGEPWAHLGHLAQVVRAHAAAGIKIQPCLLNPPSKLFKFIYQFVIGDKYKKSLPTQALT